VERQPEKVSLMDRKRHKDKGPEADGSISLRDPESTVRMIEIFYKGGICMTEAIKGKRRVQWALYIMLIPGIIITAIYSYGPLIGLSIAFQKYNFAKGLFGSEWIGLDNFNYLFMLPEFGRVVFNTVYISVMKIVLGLIFPIVVSILLNEMQSVKLKRSVQTFIYLPHFISWVIISGVLIDMLSPSTGIINQIIKAFGADPVFFLGNKDVFPYVIVVSDIWKGFGFGTIIYLAALTGIDPSLYEAAHIDGANRMQRMWNITIPGIMPVIVLNSTLMLGSVLNAGFDQVFNMYSPMVYETGDIIDTLVYRMGMQSSVPQYDIATAIGLFKSGVSFVLISSAYWLAHKVADYKIF
jgi:putative aldouronate transport system permease protein